MQCATPPVLTQTSSSRSGANAEFSVYVGNLDPDTSLPDMEELLYELFLQAGPLTKVWIPFNNKTSMHKGYGFVEFQHTESVPYCLQLMAGLRLCGRVLNLQPAAPAVPPPASTDTTAVSVASATDGQGGGNPFVSALHSHVAQKEAELVAANPFLSSLNAHLGGKQLPPPLSVAFPPPPPPSLPLPLPLPLPTPPPGLPPFFPPLSLALRTPPPFPPSSLPLLTPPLCPPPLLPPLVRPLFPDTASTSLPTPHHAPPSHPLPPPPLMQPVASTVTENGTLQQWSTPPPVPIFGTAPPPHGEPMSDLRTMSLSLEQSISDLSNHVDQTGTPPPPYAEQLALNEHVTEVTEASTQPMDGYTMSLQLCLNGRGSSSSHPPDAPIDDHSGFSDDVSSHHDHSPLDDSPYPHSNDTSGLHSLSAEKPFTTNSVVPYPRDGEVGVPQYCNDDQYISNSLLHNYESVMNGRPPSDGDDKSFDSNHLLVDVTFCDGPSQPPPDVPLNDHNTPSRTPLMGQQVSGLHRSRLGAKDYPVWMSKKVSKKIQEHHLNELQDTIGRLKEVMMMSLPAASTHPPSSPSSHSQWRQYSQ